MLRSRGMFPRSRRSWLLGAALFGAGCLSPTLPLPPPSDPTLSSDSQGLVRLSGTVQPESEVFALNQRTNLISGQYTASGRYEFTIAAEEQDLLSLWYVHDGAESPPLAFVVKLPQTP